MIALIAFSKIGAGATGRIAMQNRQVGSTLIEIMVSLLLFSFAVLGMVAMLTKAMSSAIDAQDRSRAAVLADELIATMWLEKTTSPSILSNWKSRVADVTVSGLPNAVPRVSTATDSTTSVITATVSLTWTEPSKTSSNTYSTSVVIP